MWVLPLAFIVLYILIGQWSFLTPGRVSVNILLELSVCDNFIYIYIYICVCACVCYYIYIYIYMYIYRIKTIHSLDYRIYCIEYVYILSKTNTHTHTHTHTHIYIYIYTYYMYIYISFVSEINGIVVSNDLFPFQSINYTFSP